jgi:hypothetical protein
MTSLILLRRLFGWRLEEAPPEPKYVFCLDYKQGAPPEQNFIEGFPIETNYQRVFCSLLRSKLIEAVLAPDGATCL